MNRQNCHRRNYAHQIIGFETMRSAFMARLALEATSATDLYFTNDARSPGMLNLGQLASTVQKNCHISDARHAGDFTLCIFLLKMREFFRWENDIPIAHDLPKDEVGVWLQERESLWSGIEESPFELLPLGGRRLDPFDADAINRVLIPQGHIYSGGYGRFSKPHFFLGALLKTEKRAGYTIHISSCEYARDLEAPPAMLQGKTIYVRQESVRRFLWEKIEDW